MVGGVAAALTLLPRVTATVSDPQDPNDPFSASVTITNTGYIPLDYVYASVGVGQIVVHGAQIDHTTKFSYWPHESRKEWTRHTLGLDDKFTVAMNEVWSTRDGGLDYADIAIVIDYELPIIHLQREKIFLEHFNG